MNFHIIRGCVFESADKNLFSNDTHFIARILAVSCTVSSI